MKKYQKIKIIFINVIILSVVTINLPIAGTQLKSAEGAGQDIFSRATRVVRYDVSVINIDIPVNGWGDHNPLGMIYALSHTEAVPKVAHLRDPNFKLYNTTDQTVPHKIQPLVLRANVGDCIEIYLKNELQENRSVGMQILGLPYDPKTSGGSYIGKNPNTTVAPGQTRVLRWYADKVGGYLFRDNSNVQWPQDTITKGLFGMVIVEPAGATWRDSITGRNFLKANPQNSFNYSDLVQAGTENGKPVYLGIGASIFADIHQQPGAPLPKGTLLREDVAGNDYRDYAMLMHDEFEGLKGPVAFNEDGTIAAFGSPFFPMTGGDDSTMLFNYRADPMRNRDSALMRHRGLIPLPISEVSGVRVSGGPVDGKQPNPFTNPTLGVPYIDVPLPDGGVLTVNAANMSVRLPNGKVFGPNDDFGNGGEFYCDNSREGDPQYEFQEAMGEAASLDSWIMGDPAVALPRAYWGDPVIFYVGNADQHDAHTFHQHIYRWFHSPDEADQNNLPLPDNPMQKSNRLDVQGIGAGEVFKMVYEQGAGGPQGSVGDMIFHCHLYPHFAGGIWSLFRIFDKLRINFADPNNVNSTFADATPLLYPDGTQIAVLQPLPSRAALYNTADPNAVDNRMIPPPGMPNRVPMPPDADHPGFPLFIAGRFGQKALQPPKFIIDPNTGLPTGDRATPTQLETAASYDGIAPGATLIDPCAGPNYELGTPLRKPDRIYEPVAIQVPFIQNEKGGFFNPEQRAYVEKELVDEVRRDPSLLQPYSFRMNVGDCVEIHSTNNLQPDIHTPTLGVNDGIYHHPTNTPEISNHMHFIRFDELGSSGTSTGWNYNVSQKVGETGVYRLYVDVNVRTVFSHDHQFPTSHQQNGLWSAMLIEPKGSEYRDHKTGSGLGPLTENEVTNILTASGMNVKGVGVAADIIVNNPTQDVAGGISGGSYSAFREFVVHYSDFTHSFVADPIALKAAFETLKTDPDSQAPFNPDFRRHPYYPPIELDDFGADQGTTTLNYRLEPFQARVNPDDPNKTAFQNEPAYVFSSKIHGDPETVVFRAYPGDPVVIRLMDGAHEEHHTFELHGHRWLFQPSNPQSYITDNQAFNIAEWFNFEISGNTFRNGAQLKDHMALSAGLPGDYLLGSMPIVGLWNGLWGIFRVENGLKSDLQPLPNNPPQFIDGLGLLEQTIDPSQPVPRVTPELTLSNNPAPDNAPIKHYDIVAIQKAIRYNNRFGINDPFGLLFVLAEDEEVVRLGIKQPEPLIIRANEGDRIEITLTNHLPDLTELAKNTSLMLPDKSVSASSLDPATLQHIGDAQMAATVDGLPLGGTMIGDHMPSAHFEFTKWPMSQRVSLHPHLLKTVASAGDGATVGFMPDQTVGPGESLTYIWYADKELGAVLLDSYGDLRSHRHHGLFGALIVEPKNSIYLDPTDAKVATEPLNAKRIKSGASAVIYNTVSGKKFREFVPVFADGLNLRKGSSLILDDDQPHDPGEIAHTPCSPDSARCEDVEESGESGINYRAERLESRAPLAEDAEGHASEELFNPQAYKIFSSRVFGDPATPLFESFVGDPVSIRISRAADLPKVLSIGVTGHSWPLEPTDPNSNIISVQGSFGVGKSINAHLIEGAGGILQAAGDYLYGNMSNVEPFTLQAGTWGLLRVHSQGALTKIKPLTQVLPDASTISVSSLNSNGAYGVRSIITLTVTFSQPVFVNTTSGKPSIRLETGAVDRDAVYATGSGRNRLIFRYIVRAGDVSGDLDYVSANSLSLNGATIKNGSGENVTLILPPPGAPVSLGANKNIEIRG